jgi:hypothetical protein
LPPGARAGPVAGVIDLGWADIVIALMHRWHAARDGERPALAIKLPNTSGH